MVSRVSPRRIRRLLVLLPASAMVLVGFAGAAEAAAGSAANGPNNAAGHRYGEFRSAHGARSAQLRRAEAASGIISGNFYQIQNVNSGKCMEVYHSGTANLDNVDQYTCAWDPNKEWTFNFIKVAGGADLWQLKNVGSGKCAEVYHSSSANLANVDQYTCNSSHPNQLWASFDGVGADAGQVGFANDTSPFHALEVYHSLKTNLANIDQYGPNLLSNGNFTPNQEWFLNSPL